MKRRPKKIFRIMGTIFTSFFMTLFTILIILVLSLKMITSNISIAAKELFVTTILETGQLKFLAGLLVSDDEIKRIVDKNSMKDFDEVEDTSLIEISNDDKDKIELIKVAGNSFFGKMLIINDPSRVKLATIYPWKEYGVLLDQLVNDNDALAGVNGGLYYSDSNKGGSPHGIVVSDGKILYNKLDVANVYLIGLDEEDKLRVIDLNGLTLKQREELVEKEKIRDAVAFQEQMDKDTNHFVKLVVNGKAREMQGKGSGANPRTAIGQRKDGAILLLVTDGRGKNGHLGATAKDLAKIMVKHGAINAANLDGGSSSSMYYNGEYEMTSVTFYYDNASWRLPNAFIVEKR